jgi:hypothetical protein
MISRAIFQNKLWFEYIYEECSFVRRPDDENVPFDDYYDEETTENGIRNGTMFQVIDLLQIFSIFNRQYLINSLKLLLLKWNFFFFSMRARKAPYS